MPVGSHKSRQDHTQPTLLPPPTERLCMPWTGEPLHFVKPVFRLITPDGVACTQAAGRGMGQQNVVMMHLRTHKLFVVLSACAAYHFVQPHSEQRCAAFRLWSALPLCFRFFACLSFRVQSLKFNTGIHPPPCVTFCVVVVPLRGPGQSPVLPFTCCVGLLLSAGRCGRCSC